MATWPASLPQSVQQQGYGEPFGNTAIRSEVDKGPAKMRQRFTAAISNFNITMILTTAQVATLETFYITTLAGGTAQFTWVHPRTAAAVTTMRFVKPPQISALGANYTAAMALEVLP